MKHRITLPVRDDPVKGMGWLRDYPSIRDLTPASNTERQRNGLRVAPPTELLAKTDAPGAIEAPPTGPVDLRRWCSGIEDQKELSSCTAFAGMGMFEYFQRRAFGRHIDGSHRFLYKVTRRLGGFEGDSGAFLRTTIGAMALFGVPPREHWPYTTTEFDREPPAFCYAFAQNYQALTYYRLDPPRTDPETVLNTIKGHLASQLPSMFGFTCFESLEASSENGAIPFPGPKEKITGGHAVMAVGYDNAKKINNPNGRVATTGAFLIRNSWGREWGENGYGWLPYEYVRQGLADDWWALLKNEWVDTNEFKT